MSNIKRLLTISQYIFLGFILTFSSTAISPSRAYTASNKLTIDLWYTPSHYGSTEANVATLLAEQFQSTGLITVNLHTEEWSSYIPDFVSLTKFPVFLLGWYPDYVDPDDYMYTFGTTAGTNSIGTNYQNATMNQTAVQARIDTSQAARTTLYEQMQTQLARDAVEIPMWQSAGEAYSKNSIQGVILDSSTIFRYYTLKNATTVSTITLGTSDKLVTLDPASADDYYSVNVLQNIGDGLLGYVPGTTNLALHMAKNYTVSNDGLHYNITLRNNLKFANGHVINSTTFKTSILRARDLNGDPAYLLQGLVSSIDIGNATNFKINLGYPFSVFPALMAAWVTYPVDPTTQNSTLISGSAFNDNYAGSGPYKVTAFTPGVEIDLTRNANYWNASGTPAATQNFRVKFLSNSAALTTALESGGIDIAHHTFNPSDSQTLAGMAQFHHWTGPGERIRYIVINNNIPPFNNPVIRQALAYAVNRTQIRTQVFLGTTSDLYSMVPIGMWSHIDAWKDLYGPDGNLAQSIALLQSVTSSAVFPSSLLLLAPILLGTIYFLRRKVWRT